MSCVPDRVSLLLLLRMVALSAASEQYKSFLLQWCIPDSRQVSSRVY